MVEITYHRQRHRLTAWGHAGGKKGSDPICAAVSALVLTLSANVEELAADHRVHSRELRLRDGEAWISCVPVKAMEAVVTMVYDTVCSGFSLLQSLYPENVRFRIVG